MARAVPVSRFSKVDLPTLGRPMMATLVSRAPARPLRRRQLFVACSSASQIGCGRLASFADIAAARSRAWLAWTCFLVALRRREDTPARHHAHHVFQQLGHAVAVLGRNRKQLLDPQAAKLLRVRLQLRACQPCSLPERAACPVRSSRRASSMSGAASSVRPSTTITMASASSSATRAWRKISDGISALSSGTMPPVSTTRVCAQPLSFAVDAVAGDARLVAHDGAARPNQPVEQRGLADIRTADNGERTAHGHFACAVSFDWIRIALGGSINLFRQHQPKQLL